MVGHEVIWNKILRARDINIYLSLLDMRKALSRDVKKKSMIPLTHPVRPDEVD